MAYSFSGRVRYSEIGENGLLTLPGILNYFQDCSTFHSEAAGLGVKVLKEKNKFWVLSAWQVIVNRYPYLGEEIVTSTWAYGFRGFMGFRNFTMDTTEGERLAYANTFWTFIDGKNGLPCKLSPEYTENYGLEEKLDMEYASRKIALPETFAGEEAFAVQKHHLDTNHHVNNAQYVDIAREAVPCTKRVKGIRADYKKAAVLGEILVPRVTKTGEDEWTVVLADEVCEVRAVVWLQYGEHKSNKEYGS